LAQPGSPSASLGAVVFPVPSAPLIVTAQRGEAENANKPIAMNIAVRFIEYPFAENIGVRGGIVGSKIYPKVYARLVETIRNRAKYPSRNDKPNSLLGDFYYKRNPHAIQ
jgi:hypothetical protein